MMIEHEGRDLISKEDSPSFNDADAVIKELAESMVSDGYVMSSRTSIWVSVIAVAMHDPATNKGATGVIFGGVYSTHERAIAASRGIADDILRANKDKFENIQLDNSVIETYMDVIPNGDMLHLTDHSEEVINPEDLES
jgi:hypothetical protein